MKLKFPRINSVPADNTLSYHLYFPLMTSETSDVEFLLPLVACL